MGSFEHEMERRLGARFKALEQALVAEKTRVLRPCGLTVPQYATLLQLTYVPTASAAQLARASAVSPQTMATILTNLEHKGLVERSVSPLHQKVLETRLTPGGVEVVARADAAALAVEERILAAFEPDEIDVFKSLLDRAAAAIVDSPSEGK